MLCSLKCDEIRCSAYLHVIEYKKNDWYRAICTIGINTDIDIYDLWSADPLVHQYSILGWQE